MGAAVARGAREAAAARDVVYLNNAATSHPKPREVRAAVLAALDELPGEEGRGGAGHDPRPRCRERVAAVAGVANPCRVVLLPSATHGLNVAIRGLVAPGAHVVTTMLEHNSVLRPLAHLHADAGVRVVRVGPDRDGRVDPERIAAEIRPDTALLVVAHASNVSGAVQPLESIARVAADAGVPLLVDASQSAGAIPLSHVDLPGRVYLAFSGHKALPGPAGVGVLVVPEDDIARRLVVGGTGVRSESALHPEELPLRHEAGTPNLPGIAGLSAAVDVVLRDGVDAAGTHRQQLVLQLRERLQALDGVRLLPLPDGDGRAGIVAFTLRGWVPGELAHVLLSAFGIVTRAGLHCAPLAAAVLGAPPEGTVRVSFGRCNGDDDVDAVVSALEAVSRMRT